MSAIRRWYGLGSSIAGLTMMSATVWAQVPQHTTATYDDWTVRCSMVGTSKSCDMAQSSQIQGQAVSQIVIARASKSEPMHAVFQVPINVWLPAGVRLATDKDLVSAAFKRCLGGGCFADAELKDDVIKKLRSQAENGKLLFQDAAQKDVALPVSFKGFSTAYDAMIKETQ